MNDIALHYTDRERSERERGEQEGRKRGKIKIAMRPSRAHIEVAGYLRLCPPAKPHQRPHGAAASLPPSSSDDAASRQPRSAPTRSGALVEGADAGPATQDPAWSTVDLRVKALLSSGFRHATVLWRRSASTPPYKEARRTAADVGRRVQNRTPATRAKNESVLKKTRSLGHNARRARRVCGGGDGDGRRGR